MSTKGETAGFTARDLTLLAGAMQCTKGEVQIDYKKFAEQCGFKNTDSARASWNGLRKKLDKAGGAAVGTLSCRKETLLTSRAHPVAIADRHDSCVSRRRRGGER